tara:strand:- start:11111 stop:11950 length:840 start_codon:yes stop_codon:yes gene_type:complete
MDNTIDTEVLTEQTAPVTDTESSNDIKSEETSTQKAETVVNSDQPQYKDGKWYLNDKRFYTRDETNMVAKQAEDRARQSIMKELDVDDLSQVKTVVNELRSVNSEEGQSLNVKALKDAVMKKEATLEELQTQVSSLKTELVLKDHIGKLNSAMPSNWTADQSQAVIDLMNARNMIAVEGETFALRDGDSFLTVDGETPDYSAAVEKIGKQLNFSFGKKGVDVAYGETDTGGSSAPKGIDEARLTSDASYRRAYMAIRDYNKSLTRDQITDGMIKKKMKG